MTDAVLREALERSIVAIDDWLNTYAANLCDEDDVREAQERIGKYGTLAYIAQIQQQNRAALALPASEPMGEEEIARLLNEYLSVKFDAAIAHDAFGQMNIFGSVNGIESVARVISRLRSGAAGEKWRNAALEEAALVADEAAMIQATDRELEQFAYDIAAEIRLLKSLLPAAPPHAKG